MGIVRRGKYTFLIRFALSTRLFADWESAPAK